MFIAIRNGFMVLRKYKFKLFECHFIAKNKNMQIWSLKKFLVFGSRILVLEKRQKKY